MDSSNHEQLLHRLKEFTGQNEEEKDNFKKKSPLKKPTFVYNHKNKNQHIDYKKTVITIDSNTYKSPTLRFRNQRKNCAPYHKCSLDSYFENLNLTSNHNLKPRITSEENSLKTGQKFLSLNNVPCFPNTSATGRSDSVLNSNHKNIIQPSKLKMVSFKHSPRKMNLPQKTVDKWKPKPSSQKLSFRDVKNLDKLQTLHINDKSPRDGKAKPFSSKYTHSSTSKNKSHASHCVRKSCSFEARNSELDITPDELALYIDDYLVLPKKMSSMAEMMYL